MLSRGEGDLGLMRCDECGLVFLDGWSSAFEAELYAYYDARVGASREERYDPLTTARQRELLAAWAPRVRGRRLLDVGCGEGQLVATALDERWAARGIDLATGAIQVCASFGLPCEVLDFFDASLDAERYDVITMSELLEHVPRPGRFLARASSLLAPGGLLYATTPNFDSLTRRLVGPRWSCIHREHIAYFTEATLSSLAAASMPGCRVRVRSKNLSLGEIAQRLRPAPARGETCSPQEAHQVAARSRQRRLRALIAGSRGLSLAKRGANALVGAAGVGDTLILTAQRS
ncbi:MAG: class I SAM-dependent methyltransferase [Sandaracinaceae bacterium]|nr:class I SAM-dependent methyltransferase [Sandaracinaceae bacterium]